MLGTLLLLAGGVAPLAGQLDSARIRSQCDRLLAVPDQAILYGAVTDRLGRPAEEGRVQFTWEGGSDSVEEGENRFATDVDDGVYIVCDVPQGTAIRLWAHANRLASAPVDLALRVGEMRREDLSVVVGRPLGAISGILIDESTDRPVAGATLRIPEAGASAVTGSGGRFRIAGVPTGSQEVLIRHIAFGEPRVTLEVEAGMSTHARLRLRPRAIALAPLTVEVAASEIAMRVTWLEDAEFYHRMERGLGSFVPPEEIDRQRYRGLADVLRTIPAVNLRESCSPRCEVLLELAGQTASGCMPTFYVDRRELRVSRPVDLDMIAPGGDIAAIEVYRGISETPPQFYGRCGSIVIWTRRGTR